jgi:hypothetical protein
MKILKKMKYLVVGLSLVGTSLFASESMYVGVGGIVGTGTQTVTFNDDSSYSADYTISGATGKIGFITRSEK